MRLLYLDWPHLPYRLEAVRRQLPELVVVGGQPWDPGTVLDCSPDARRLGVRHGQPLGSAHTLVPEASFLTADKPFYSRSIGRALDALAEFTPAVEAETAPDDRRFGQVLLGIEGLHRLWGDEATLVGRVVKCLASLLPGPPRVGIGNTRFGAQVAAVVGSKRAAAGSARDAGSAPTGSAREAAIGTIPPGDAAVEAAYLAALPITLLPADDETRARLRLFGLARMGEFAALSRSAVVARFGEQGGMLHDLCRGLDGRPLRPRRPVEHLRAEAELDPPVEDLEPLRFVLRQLCAALCEQLAARGSGAGHAILELELESAEPLRVAQPLPEPVAAPDLIERLLLARLTAAPPAAAVSRLALQLDGTAPAAGQQLGLFAPQLARAGRLEWQLAGLSIRFGADRLLRARVVDSEALLPEERIEWARVSAGSV